MATLLTTIALFFGFTTVLTLAQNLLSCDTNSPEALGYRCNDLKLQHQCSTFAMLHANSYFSSLSNLSLYLGLDRKLISAASGFSENTDLLPNGKPFLIPIDCRCNKDFFEASLTKTTIIGETFYQIAESLEGLTTCKAIQRKNPGLSPWSLQEKIQLLIPLRCACPSQLALQRGTKLILSYPVKEGDTVSNLASEFNTTLEDIQSYNNRSGGLKSFSTLMIPLTSVPVLAPFPNPGGSSNSSKHHSSGSKLRKIGVYFAFSSIVVGVGIVVFAVIFIYRLRKNEPNFCKWDDVELQHLSIRTRSEIKTVSENSLDTCEDTQTIDTTPHKMVVELYTLEELKKATEDFNSSNFIEGAVFHGRLSGKNLAIKRTSTEMIPRIEFEIFQEAYHHNPRIIRLLGTCLIDGPDSFLVFEYAKNGSLKDWLHGGLAMKSQFIASCYCFLTWNQRLRICLDVAMALEYMHRVMIPSYVHRNIKSRNIFLDEEFNAKIGNFGMARCTEDNTEDGNSLSVQALSWNRGYLAPEYLRQGTISSSVDIFAYGVILLEVLSGQPPILRDDKKGDGIVLISDKIKAILTSDDSEELRNWMDNALGEAYSFDMAVTLAYIARSCVEEDPSCRPSAGELVEKLSKLVKELSGAQSLTRTSSSSSKPQAKVLISNP